MESRRVMSVPTVPCLSRGEPLGWIYAEHLQNEISHLSGFSGCCCAHLITISVKTPLRRLHPKPEKVRQHQTCCPKMSQEPLHQSECLDSRSCDRSLASAVQLASLRGKSQHAQVAHRMASKVFRTVVTNKWQRTTDP